jgi:hypothetical protein
MVLLTINTSEVPGMQSLDRLLHLLTLLERQHGLSDLEKDERRVFDFIVEATSQGVPVAMSQILKAQLVSRASTYRHVAALLDQRCIEEGFENGERVFTVASRFGDLARELRDAALATS